MQGLRDISIGNYLPFLQDRFLVIRVWHKALYLYQTRFL